MLEVLRLNKAKEIVKKNISSLIKKEIISLENSSNRILAEKIFSRENLPQFKRSTVDGYALKASSTYGCSQSIPTILKLKNIVKMNEETKIKISSEECSYVPTGGMVPSTCNAVVMIENTKQVNKEILIYSPCKVNENIINVGEDIKEKKLMLETGKKLTPPRIGILAGNGISKVPVFKKIKYSIISTGDEIVPIESKLQACNIRDINSYTIYSKMESIGTFSKKYLVKDDLNSLKKTINESLKNSDLIFISGGSSVGTKDFTLRALEEIGAKVLIHGLALKPGKPTMFATKGNKILIGLPGHPMACLTSLEQIFINPYLEKIGYKEQEKIYAKAEINFPNASGKDTIMPVRLTYKKETILAYPLFYKSGLINILSIADGYTIISNKEEGINKGTTLEIFKL